MRYSKMVKQYRKTNVETAGKLDLVIMCYEKAIEFLSSARSCHERHLFEKKAEALQKGLDIINELRCSLNMTEGGQISKNLDAIYAYLNKRLLVGDIEKDLGAFDEAIRIMGELKEAWEGIAINRHQGQVASFEDHGRASPAQLAV